MLIARLDPRRTALRAGAGGRMAEARGWQRNREMWIRLLEKRTGEGVETWNGRVARQGLDDEPSLRAWLSKVGVTGYAQTLLVMERLGYPEFLLATPDQLIDAQYADRAGLRPICDAIIRAGTGLGNVTVQARKTYISLLSERRTFARIQSRMKTRLDLGLRLARQRPAGRLRPSKTHEIMQLQISLTAPEQVDAEVVEWLRLAYEENR